VQRGEEVEKFFLLQQFLQGTLVRTAETK